MRKAIYKEVIPKKYHNNCTTGGKSKVAVEIFFFWSLLFADQLMAHANHSSSVITLGADCLPLFA